MLKRKAQFGVVCCMAVLAVQVSYALETVTGKALLPKSAETSQKGNIAPLPIPDASDPTKLSLTNAVLLSLRRNPNLKMDFNNRKVSRYDLLSAEQAFRPQVSMSGGYSYTKNRDGASQNDVLRNTNFGPTVTWKLPTGTSFTGTYTYNPSLQTGDGAYTNKHYGWSIDVKQPLLKGFGWDVNMADLRNAHDNQKKADYTLEQNIISTITTVMTDYYGVVQAKETLHIAKVAEKDAKKDFAKRKALYQAGRVSRSDLSQAQLTATQKQSSIAADVQKFNLAREKLMNDLALPENTRFHVDNSVPVKPIHPNLAKSVEEAMKNNLGLKIAKIGFIEAKRNLVKSKNAQLPELDLEYNDVRNRTTQTTTSPVSSTRTVSNNSTISLELNIPLDRVSIDKESLQSAITMQNEQITMQNTRRQLRNSVVTAVENLDSQYEQIKSDQINLKLAENNYKASEVKYQYGKLDAFTLAQQQEQLQTTQNNVVSADISYLQAVTSYEKLVGTVLPTWHIHLEGIKNATEI